MKIYINEDKKRSVRLCIPLGTSLGLFIVKSFIFKKLRKSGVKPKYSQKRLISKAFKNAAKTLKGYKIVEVLGKSGEKVDIYL